MRVLLHTRTANELDWEKRVVELAQLPREGEHVSVNREGQRAEWHHVRVVLHVADPGGFEAEVYCLRLSAQATRKLMFGQGNDAQTPETHANVAPILLTLKQAADAVSVSVDTLQRLIAAGRLKATDLGTGGKRHDWRINPEDLKEIAPSARSSGAEETTRRRVRRRRFAPPASVQSILPRVDEGTEPARR